MERRNPEQLNTPEASQERMEPSALERTLVFRPIRTVPPEPQLDAPMKVAPPDGKGEVREVKEPPQTPPAREPPIREAPPKRRGRQPAVNQRPPIRVEPPQPPADPQALLRQTRSGLNAMRLRLYVLALLVLGQLFLACYGAFSWQFLPIPARTRGILTLALCLLSLILGRDVLLRGTYDLLRLRITPFALSLPATVLTLLHTAQSLARSGESYCPVLSLLLLLLLRALLSEQSSQFYTLRTVCGFSSPMGIFSGGELLEGAPTLRRDAGQMEDFLHALRQPDGVQTALRIYASVLLPASALLAVLLAQRCPTGFFTAWMLLLLGGLPFPVALAYVRPFAALARRLSRFGGALCGWYGAKRFGGRRTIVLRDEDVFPQGSVSSNGIKLYGSFSAARVLACALAALEAVDSPLSPLFESLLRAQNGRRMTASAHRAYDNNGVGAEVQGEVVLIGALPFMRSMGVHMPGGTHVRQAVYVSVDGELAGIVALKYKPSPSTKKGLSDVLSNRNFSVVLATRDFLISPELLASKYELPMDALRFPAYTERLRLSGDAENGAGEQGALIARDTFGAFAATVAAGRRLRHVSRVSLVLCFLSGLLGLVLCTLLIVWNAPATPLHLAAFQLIWALLDEALCFILLRF